MEGVGEDGRMFLLKRPNADAVQNKLWMLYLNAEKQRDEMKDQLKFKVEQLARREEGLREWQDALSNKEYKLEHGEDNLSALMRELRVKDMLLADKDCLIKQRDREIEDGVR